MLVKAKRYINNCFHPYVGELWCLHRIVLNRSDIPSLRELQITPSFLEQQIVKCQRKGYKFVSIDDILGNNSSIFLSQKKINITFDDGFADIYKYAFPLFLKHSIPFTIYLTTDFPDGKADIWWEQLSYFENYEYNIANIYKSNKQMSNYMHIITSSLPDDDLCKDLSLSWQMIEEMIQSGLCTIGSHTVSHPGLTRCPESVIISELTESKKIIEDKLGIIVKHFSYPHSMINNDVYHLVKQAGYSTAVLGSGGKIRKGDNMYKLNRVYLTEK